MSRTNEVLKITLAGITGAFIGSVGTMAVGEHIVGDMHGASRSSEPTALTARGFTAQEKQGTVEVTTKENVIVKRP